MTQRNKKILWSILGVTLATLAGLYIFVPAVHNWVNDLIGVNDKAFPTPNSKDDVEYEYGIPTESLNTEKLEMPRDSLLDSLIHADTTITAGVVNPVEGPQPGHVEGFGEGPLPPKPTDDNLPNRTPEAPQGQEQVVTPEQMEQLEINNNTPPLSTIDLDMHMSHNTVINKKIQECHNGYEKLLSMYNEYQSAPTPTLKEEGTKLKENLLKSLTQLMDMSNEKNDTEGQEEAGQLRREVNKMEFL